MIVIIEKNEHVASMGEMRGAYRVLVERLREGDHLEDPGIHRRMILKWIFENCDAGGGGGKDGIDIPKDRDR
jgi:hypothetical protein